MDPKNLTKEYTNGEITVVWKPGLCIHSRICWNEATGLREVFNPKLRPWINMEGSDSERIMQQVKQCPSGALSFYRNGEVVQTERFTATKVEVMPNGPLLVHGDITVKNQHGAEEKKTNTTAFCRCGQSGNKPYCDGSHSKSGWQGSKVFAPPMLQGSYHSSLAVQSHNTICHFTSPYSRLSMT
jgi:CDGSH-type Zn-finger protein/uncharacterized Fe-S cluster protein YjdI